MAEDWRVTVNLSGSSGLDLRSSIRELEHDAKLVLGKRVAVSASDSQVFLYADDRATAEQAQAAARTILDREGAEGELILERWHPIAEEWEPGDVPLPATPSEQAREHETLEAQDTADSEATGYAEWEVRIDLPSRHEAVELATRLESEGLPVARRWRFVVVGAENSDDAEELAKRIKPEVPSDARVQVEPGGEMVWDVIDPGWGG